MLHWRRPRAHEHADGQPPAVSPLRPDEGLRLSDGLGVVITGLGCLHANVTQAAMELQRALAAGTVDGERANEAANKLRNAHRDIESACRLISGARIAVTPDVAESAPEAHHG